MFSFTSVNPFVEIDGEGSERTVGAIIFGLKEGVITGI
jgi:hypothetical protein